MAPAGGGAAPSFSRILGYNSLVRAITVRRQVLTVAIGGIAFLAVYFSNRYAHEWGLEEQSAPPWLAFAFGCIAGIVGFVVSWCYTDEKRS